MYAQTNQQGDVVVLIEQIRNVMPGQNSNGFVVPTTAEKNYFGDLITKIMTNQFDSISTKADLYGYSFIRWYNIPTAETLYILKENNPIIRGWGTYISNPQGTLNCTIEAPHPIWDTKSWRLAILDFLKLKAQWFIMAGTHRYANSDNSSDVAHATQTIFHKTHQTIVTDMAIQIHGFSKSDGDHPGYPDVVISSGILYPQSLLFTIKSSYESEGMTAGVYSISTQSSLSDLAATTNKQGQWSYSNGKLFIHIEHDTPIRTDSTKTTKAVQALYQALVEPTVIQDNEATTPSSIYLSQNFPNPFNPSTSITFHVPAVKTSHHSGNAHVMVKVYDASGKEVTTVINEQMSAGTYTRSWDAGREQLSSGMYFLSLIVEEQQQVRKILFIQ